LRTAKPLPVGASVRCSSCGTAFVVPPFGIRPPPTLSGNTLLLWLAAVGGVLASLVVATIALAISLRDKKLDPAPVAEISALVVPNFVDVQEELEPITPVADDRPVISERPKKKEAPRDVSKPMMPPPLLSEPAPRAKVWLPPEQQQKVDTAIEHGTAWLKKKQQGDGSWGRFEVTKYQVGLAALPALTLLECGFSPDDPAIRKAVDCVRKGVPDANATYDLALAILFLDRLGEVEDHARIRTMALRLIAGQSPSGGWTYRCPVLGEKDELELLALLEQTSRGASLEKVTMKPGEAAVDRVAGKPPADGESMVRRKEEPAGRVTTPPKRNSTKQIKVGGRLPSALDVGKLSDLLRGVPALQHPEKLMKHPDHDESDNSNTQFAILGLWAAGRHDVPMEQTIALIDKRFRVSQAPSGGWGYKFQQRSDESVTESMTGAGLLGLAVGHGLTAADGADTRRPPVEDPSIERGLKALGETIGEARPRANRRRLPPNGGIHLYSLWTLERVGVLYNLQTISGKDWYAWGSELLLDAQNREGAWHMSGYHGSVPTHDTCFALLFLKRANLTQDLSRKLEFVIQVRERQE